MAFPQQFIQLMGLLSEMSARRQQGELAQRELDMKNEQFKTATKQWEAVHQDKDTTDALQQLADASLEGRQARLRLMRSGHFTDDQMQAFSQFAAGMPISPNILAAQSAQRGYDQLTPEQRATVDREAALRVGTGMNEGQMGGSQLTGAMATGGPPPGQLGQVIPQQQWGNMIQNFATRAAGQGLEQMALQQGQLKFQYDQLGLQEKQILGELGIKGAVADGKAALTPAERVDAIGKISKLLEDMNSPRSDAAGNFARKKVIGMASLYLGLPADFFVEQPTSPAGAPTPSTPFRQFWQGQPGFAPGMGGPTSGVPRF